MSTPEYVPLGFSDRVRRLESEVPPLPIRRLPFAHPGGPSSGTIGRLQGRPAPDAGYALNLVGRFASQLTLAPEEDGRDALTAGAVLGMARAAHFGRAPIIHDVRVGLEVLGYLGGAPSEMVAWRIRALQNVHRDQFRQLQLLGVDPTVLEMSPGQAPALLRDWRQLLPAELSGLSSLPGIPLAPDGPSHGALVTLLAGGRDPVKVRRFVHELGRHLAAERSELSRLPADRWAVIERGQSRLLAEAAALESSPRSPEQAATEVGEHLALQVLAEDDALELLRTGQAA